MQKIIIKTIQIFSLALPTVTWPKLENSLMEKTPGPQMAAAEGAGVMVLHN